MYTTKDLYVRICTSLKDENFLRLDVYCTISLIFLKYPKKLSGKKN